MRVGVSRPVREKLSAVRAWPLWELPRWLVVFIMAVVAVYAVALAVAARMASITTHDVVLFGALLLCVAATVELTRRAGENAGVILDVYAVWELPAAILLPPVYAMIMPIVRWALSQWRTRPIPLHRRVFSAAVVGLSYGAASLTFHALPWTSGGVAGQDAGQAAVWMLCVVAAAATQWTVNRTLLLPAIKGANPAIRIREMFWAREAVRNDVAELCVTVLVALGIAISLLTILFALPFVTLLQRSVRHAQLVNASRIDSKTGLLNAGTWEREAASEVARAVRTRTPLALALVDIDHFKSVNDVHGHLAGDKALQAIARTFRIFLREYDLVGRFGGEEFALLLPHARALDAYGIAERIREHIAAMLLDDVGAPGGQPVQVTVSIGVAALGTRWGSGTGSQLTDLLAAADRALYQAKRAGRDQVCVVTDSTVLTMPSADAVEPA